MPEQPLIGGVGDRSLYIGVRFCGIMLWVIPGQSAENAASQIAELIRVE
jgi:hypothetical protein